MFGTLYSFKNLIDDDFGTCLKRNVCVPYMSIQYQFNRLERSPKTSKNQRIMKKKLQFNGFYVRTAKNMFPELAHYRR